MMEKYIAVVVLYAILANLFGVGWMLIRRDFITGWYIAVLGGSGVGLVLIALSIPGVIFGVIK